MKKSRVRTLSKHLSSRYFNLRPKFRVVRNRLRLNNSQRRSLVPLSRMHKQHLMRFRFKFRMACRLRVIWAMLMLIQVNNRAEELDQTNNKRISNRKSLQVNHSLIQHSRPNKLASKSLLKIRQRRLPDKKRSLHQKLSTLCSTKMKLLQLKT